MSNFKAHWPDLQEVIADFIPPSRKLRYPNVHNTHSHTHTHLNDRMLLPSHKMTRWYL